MIGKDRHYTGFISTNNQNQYPVADDFGRSARQLDAQRMLEEMDKAEQEVQQREQRNAEIESRIRRETAAMRLSTDYLISFGVAAEHRHEFRSILQETAQNGGLTLRAAADLAYARGTPIDQSGNALES